MELTENDTIVRKLDLFMTRNYLKDQYYVFLINTLNKYCETSGYITSMTQ